jgi:hypothetical protein
MFKLDTGKLIKVYEDNIEVIKMLMPNSGYKRDLM